MTTRTRFYAEYFYPGSFLPETATADIDMPTRKAAEAAKPNGKVGYTDTCYGIRLYEVAEEMFTSGDKSIWVKQSNEEIDSWIYGTEYHYTDPFLAGPEYDILRSNVRSNDPNGMVVKSVAGNWQIREDWNRVV